MPAVEVEVSRELVEELQSTMNVVGMLIKRKRRAFQKEGGIVEMLVARVEGGLKVHLQFDEHPPPHFSVRHPEGVARFRIDNGQRLKPDRSLVKYDRAIQQWHKKHRRKLILDWNASRPSDCTVGEMPVPKEEDDDNK